MNKEEQLVKVPYYVFEVDFLQPTLDKPWQHKVFVYQKPMKTYNHTTKQPEEALYPQTAWYDLDDYYKILEGKITTKAEYLAWRQEWKKGYIELSKLIQYAKNNRKQDYADKKYEQYEWAMRAVFGKLLARRMMLLLAAAKDISWQNKLKTTFKNVEVIAL